MKEFSIRPFTEADIPHAADLHRRGFALPERPGQQEAYAKYFRTTFLESPSADPECPSLAAVDNDGRIIGFLGVVIRPMYLDREPIRAALSSEFVVDPNWRNHAVGLEILKRFFSGPQDLSFTDEAVEPSAIIWQRLGGSCSPAHSLHWVAPLRPAALLLLKIRRSSHRHRFLPALARPFARAGDELMSLIMERLRSAGNTRLHPQTQNPHLLFENLHELRREWTLAPDYKLQDIERLIA